MAEELSISQSELARMSPSEQKQLQTFIENESQRSEIQKTIHELTETCFKKCITGSISGGKLNGKEETCMSNCVNRIMDSHLHVLQHLERLRANQ